MRLASASELRSLDAAARAAAWSAPGADPAQALMRLAALALADTVSEIAARLPVRPEVLAVAGHMRRGAWVSSHAHLNVTYLFVADPTQPLRVKPDENSAVRWAALDDIFVLSTEPWLCKHVYEKLVARTRDLLG